MNYSLVVLQLKGTESEERESRGEDVCVSRASGWAGLAGSQQGYIAPCQAEAAPSGGADRLPQPQEYCNIETEGDRERDKLK